VAGVSRPACRPGACLDPVYICLCNGFTDRQVRSTIERSASSLAQVYAALGCEPRCGKCVPFVQEMLRSAAPEASGETAA
jgi:bacterioferritin-associated ferredoxin